MTKALFEVKGFDQLQKKLKSLPDKVKKKEVVRVLRKSAKDTISAARREAPQSKKPHTLKGGKVIQPGNTKKSIKFQVMRRAKNPGGIVGPRSLGKYDGFYARQFVIPGHNIYRVGFKRNRRGNQKFNSRGAKRRVPENPFMARAFNQTKGRVTDKAREGIEKLIQKQINSL